MNQILSTKIENKKIKKNWFKIQLYTSLFIIGVLIISIYVYINNLYKKEQLSNSLINNYSIYKLYSSNSKEETNTNTLNSILGIIQIPKINLYYPVFSRLNEDLLKIAPCKFYGEGLDKNSNICIAGHNYDNDMFFSKLNNLSVNDVIYIYDINGTKYTYIISNIYEVDPSDLTPIFNYKKTDKTLTLVTCNNMNSNRIIVRANNIN